LGSPSSSTPRMSCTLRVEKSNTMCWNSSICKIKKSRNSVLRNPSTLFFRKDTKCNCQNIYAPCLTHIQLDWHCQAYKRKQEKNTKATHLLGGKRHHVLLALDVESCSTELQDLGQSMVGGSHGDRGRLCRAPSGKRGEHARAEWSVLFWEGMRILCVGGGWGWHWVFFSLFHSSCSLTSGEDFRLYLPPKR
jgi:hypothetical protein